jgi:hypothetical protein
MTASVLTATGGTPAPSAFFLLLAAAAASCCIVGCVQGFGVASPVALKKPASAVRGCVQTIELRRLIRQGSKHTHTTHNAFV